MLNSWQCGKINLERGYYLVIVSHFFVNTRIYSKPSDMFIRFEYGVLFSIFWNFLFQSLAAPDDYQAVSVGFTSVKKCKAIITELIENTVLRSLVIIGKRQDQCKFRFVKKMLSRFRLVDKGFFSIGISRDMLFLTSFARNVFWSKICPKIRYYSGLSCPCPHALLKFLARQKSKLS